MNRCVFLVGLVAACAAHAGNTVYKSTNPDGTVVYGDHPPADGTIDKTFEFADLPSSTVPDVAPPSTAKGKPAAARRAPPGGVALFSAAWCGYCRLAKAYLQKNGIAYRNIDVDTADGKALFVRAGGGGIPLFFNETRYIRGFSEQGYDAFFAGR